MELFDTKKTTPFALRIPIWPGTLHYFSDFFFKKKREN